MKKLYFLLSVGAIWYGSLSSLSAGGSVQVGIGGGDCSSAWAGPGMYYNVWFNNPNDFYGWCQNPYWIGPGFYYGVWFDNQWDYNGWRRNNRYNRGRHYYNHDGHGNHGGGGHHGGGGGHHGGGGGQHHGGGGGHGHH